MGISRVVVDGGIEIDPGNTDPDDLGDWESSGIVDISEFFGDAPGGSIFVFNVQAHSVRGGNIGRDNLVQGGQILVLFKDGSGNMNAAILGPIKLSGPG